MDVSNLTGSSRRRRVVTVSGLSLLIGAILALAVLMVMNSVLPPESSQGERLVLPALVMIFFAILAVFAPVMPIWPIDVPDNQIWMILDSNDHLLRYVSTGNYMIRPIQDYQPYANAGALVVNIDDDSFLSKDLFPYRVRANIVCTHNPLNADESRRVGLRAMTKEVMLGILKTQIEYIVRGHLAEYRWDGLNLKGPLEVMSQAITAAVEQLKPMGISLILPINLFLDLPKVAVDLRQRRMAVASLANPEDVAARSQSFADLVKLISMTGDANLAIDEKGKIRFSLDPGKRTEVTMPQAVLGALGALSGFRPMPGEDSPVMKLLSAPRQEDEVIPSLDVTQRVEPQPQEIRIEHTQEIVVPNPPEETDTKPTRPRPDNSVKVPRNPILDNVVDTDQDEEGNFVPRNPIVDG